MTPLPPEPLTFVSQNAYQPLSC